MNSVRPVLMEDKWPWVRMTVDLDAELVPKFTFVPRCGRGDQSALLSRAGGSCSIRPSAWIPFVRFDAYSWRSGQGRVPVAYESGMGINRIQFGIDYPR